MKITLIVAIIAIIIESALLIIFGGVILYELAGFTVANETLFQSRQPEEIDYGSYDPYTLSIIKQERLLGSNYIAIMSKDAEPSYGYVINYPSSYIVSEKALEESEVEWTESGVELGFGVYGESVFISREAFIGGR